MTDHAVPDCVVKNPLPAVLVWLGVLLLPLGLLLTQGAAALHYVGFGYPLVVASVWLGGGLAYWWQWERRWRAWSGRPDCPDLPDLPSPPPRVSVLIACHNAAGHIEATVRAALQQRYPNLEVVVINDGSTDATGEVLERMVREEAPASEMPEMRLRVLHHAREQGRALALRTGALAARSEYLVCLSGDARLAPDAVHFLVAPLVAQARLGAVTGNPRVRNRSGWVGQMQVGEFAAMGGLMQRAQHVCGLHFGRPGTVTALRRTALDRVGYWSRDTGAEALDLAWKLQRSLWAVAYEPRALCQVTVPETVRGLWRQRRRWAQGKAEVFAKHLRSLWRWHSRRVWPLALAYCASVVWALAVALSIGLWLLGQFVALPEGLTAVTAATRLAPPGVGVLLAFACLAQVAVSLLVERRYEAGLARTLAWVVWYPLAYWLLLLGTTLVSFPSVLRRKKSRGSPGSPQHSIQNPERL